MGAAESINIALLTEGKKTQISNAAVLEALLVKLPKYGACVSQDDFDEQSQFQLQSDSLTSCPQQADVLRVLRAGVSRTDGPANQPNPEKES